MKRTVWSPRAPRLGLKHSGFLFHDSHTIQGTTAWLDLFVESREELRCAGGVGEEEPKLDHALSTLGLSFLADHWGVALVVSELTSKVGIMCPIFTHLLPRAAGGFAIPLIPVSCSPSANQDPARG